MMPLKYDETSHYDGEVTLGFIANPVHRYTANGKFIPSVSGILGMYGESSDGLISWGSELALRKYHNEYAMVGKVPDQYEVDDVLKDLSKTALKERSRLANMGSHAHDFAEKWFRGEKPELPEHLFVRRSCERFLDWVSDNKVKPLQMEFRVISRTFWYAGTADLLCEVAGARCLVDYKTSKEWREKMAMQLAAYQYARHEEVGNEIESRWVLIMPGGDDGELDFHEFTEYERDLADFIECRAKYERKRNWKKKGQPLEGWKLRKSLEYTVKAGELAKKMLKAGGTK